MVSLSLPPAVEPASHHTSPSAHSTGTGVWQGGARNIYTMIYDTQRKGGAKGMY